MLCSSVEYNTIVFSLIKKQIFHLSNKNKIQLGSKLEI